MIRNAFLVYQAKSFYNAYIALEQITKTSENQLMYFVPMLVNGSFSVEITLKAILNENCIDYGKEHNLLILFQQLPDSFQNELLGHLVEKAPEYNNPEKCAEELLLISNAFVDWRYSFEGKAPPALNTRFLSAFANAAIWTMFSHYNVDFIPASDEKKTEAEIDETIRSNREDHIAKNLKWLHKKKQSSK